MSAYLNHHNMYGHYGGLGSSLYSPGYAGYAGYGLSAGYGGGIPPYGLGPYATGMTGYGLGAYPGYGAGVLSRGPGFLDRSYLYASALGLGLQSGYLNNRLALRGLGGGLGLGMGLVGAAALGMGGVGRGLRGSRSLGGGMAAQYYAMAERERQRSWAIAKETERAQNRLVGAERRNIRNESEDLYRLRQSGGFNTALAARGVGGSRALGQYTGGYLQPQLGLNTYPARGYPPAQYGGNQQLASLGYQNAGQTQSARPSPQYAATGYPPSPQSFTGGA